VEVSGQLHALAALFLVEAVLGGGEWSASCAGSVVPGTY
jgi:hypothetical protein